MRLRKTYLLLCSSEALNSSSYIIFIFLLLSNILNAQIQTRLDPQVILVGDTASLQLTVTADSRQKVTLPQPGDSLNRFIEITEVKTDTLQRGNNINYIQNFTITSFENGKFLVNALPVEIDGKMQQSSSHIIEVQDLVVGDDLSKMFPVKPIMKEEITFWEKYKKYFWYFAAAMLLAFIAGMIIFLYFKEKKKNKYVSTPLLPPYQEALDNLLKLDRASYIEKQKYYEYYSDLSFILRRYFTRRFDFPANALLSDDLPEVMEQNEYITREESKEMIDFLHDADLAKYARTVPSEDKHKHFRDWVENIIHRTRPLMEEDVTEQMRFEGEEEKLRKIDNR